MLRWAGYGMIAYISQIKDRETYIKEYRENPNIREFVDYLLGDDYSLGGNEAKFLCEDFGFPVITPNIPDTFYIKHHAPGVFVIYDKNNPSVEYRINIQPNEDGNTIILATAKQGEEINYVELPVTVLASAWLYEKLQSDGIISPDTDLSNMPLKNFVEFVKAHSPYERAEYTNNFMRLFEEIGIPDQEKDVVIENEEMEFEM